jgi:hypothetical protein
VTIELAAARARRSSSRAARLDALAAAPYDWLVSHDAGAAARPRLILLAAPVLGGLYGYATAAIPSPHDVSVFWVGNFCAPWLVLAFLAGRTQPSWRTAVLAGLLADAGCVAGFYLDFLTLDPLELGLATSTDPLTVATTSFGRWIEFIAYWLVAAVAGGAIYGALGRWWRQSRSPLAAVAVAAPFLAEPVLWPLRNGYYQGPWPLWVAEVAVGLAILAALVTIARRTRVTSPAA